MKVATFNLYQFAAPPFFWYQPTPYSTYSSDQWQAKCDWIITQLQRMDADIVAFQEVFSVTALQRLCQKAGYPEFLTVDRPTVDPKNPNVYLKPIVAIASRYPYHSVQSIQATTPQTQTTSQTQKIAPPPQPLESSPATSPFAFSRSPIKAKFETSIGDLLIYGVHLKSKRPDITPVTDPLEMSLVEKVKETMLRQSRGHVAALQQRGLEALHLYQDMVDELAQNTPIILLGDLNDIPDSIPIRAMTLQSDMPDFGTGKSGTGKAVEYDESLRNQVDALRLNDSALLTEVCHSEESDSVENFSYLHHGQRQILDFVLVSHAFHPSNPEPPRPGFQL